MFSSGETVTRLRATTEVDAYGAEVLSWESPDELVIPGCAVADGGLLEPTEDARNARWSDFDVMVPPGADVEADDRLVVRGLPCEVVGRPFQWKSPFSSWAPGAVIRCTIVEG